MLMIIILQMMLLIILAGKSPDVIADIQADLVNIGYLSPGQFVPGVWEKKMLLQ